MNMNTKEKIFVTVVVVLGILPGLIFGLDWKTIINSVVNNYRDILISIMNISILLLVFYFWGKSKMNRRK